MTSIPFLLEVISYISNVIFVSISLYWILSQCKQNHEMYIQKRSLSIYYALNISLVMSMPGVILMVASLLHFNGIGKIFSVWIGSFAFWAFLYFLLVKNWMIYYKYKWTYYTIELQWSYIINSKSTSTESDTNWFIINNKKYGNLWYIWF